MSSGSTNTCVYTGVTPPIPTTKVHSVRSSPRFKVALIVRFHFELDLPDVWRLYDFSIKYFQNLTERECLLLSDIAVYFKYYSVRYTVQVILPKCTGRYHFCTTRLPLVNTGHLPRLNLRSKNQ